MSQARIEAPNNTQIPNIIFDYWMNLLTGAEYKVLMCICRKTFGWPKAIKSVSLLQIQEMTSLSRSTIIKSIDTLIEFLLVTKIESGLDELNSYEINVKELTRLASATLSSDDEVTK